MTENEYILLNEMIDNCKNAQGYDDPKREMKYQMLLKVLSIVEKEGKWDTNKDTRNSRQRIANYQVLKQLRQTAEDLGYLKGYTYQLLTALKEQTDKDSLEYNDVLYMKSSDIDNLYNKFTSDTYNKAKELIEFRED